MKHIVKSVQRKNPQTVTVLPKDTDIKLKTKVIRKETPQKKLPLINIITRTSSRPNGFSRCHQSILNQTYPNIRHIVSIDNLKDKEYVEQYEVDYYFIDKEKVKNSQDIPDPKTGGKFIYNLYFNILFNKVKEGWIMILDDDDYLADNNAVQSMVDVMKKNTDLVVWQMKYPMGNLLPTIQEMNAKPRLARIGSPCILVHGGIAKTIRWDGWKCGDYRYISKVWSKTGGKRWIKKPLVSLGSGGGFGLRKDIAAPKETPPVVNVNVKKKEQLKQKKQKPKPVTFESRHKLKVAGRTTTPDSKKNIYTIEYTYNLLKEKLDKGENFSFLRFGDNDFMHVLGQNKGRALGHNKTVFNQLLQLHLINTLKIEDENFIRTYNFGGYSIFNPLFRKPANTPFNVPVYRQIRKHDTNSIYHQVLFFYLIVGYYPEYVKNIFSPIKKSPDVLYIGGVDKTYTKPFLGDVKTQIQTQKTNSTKYIQKYIEILDKTLAINEYKYIILACGQLSRVLGGHIFRTYGNKYTVLDIGGIIETFYPKTTKNAVVKYKKAYQKNLRF